MGSGNSYVCSKCKKHYNAFWGTGKFFPKLYADTVADVKAGKYGEMARRIMCNKKFVAIDAAQYVYICSKCHYWKVAKDMSLYILKNPKALMKKYGLESDEKLNNRPYVDGYMLQKEYRILKRYNHVCDKCKRIMHKSSGKERDKLPCPDCGGAPDKQDYSGMILWD